MNIDIHHGGFDIQVLSFPLEGIKLLSSFLGSGILAYFRRVLQSILLWNIESLVCISTIHSLPVGSTAGPFTFSGSVVFIVVVHVVTLTTLVLIVAFVSVILGPSRLTGNVTFTVDALFTIGNVALFTVGNISVTAVIFTKVVLVIFEEPTVEFCAIVPFNVLLTRVVTFGIIVLFTVNGCTSNATLLTVEFMLNALLLSNFSSVDVALLLGEVSLTIIVLVTHTVEFTVFFSVTILLSSLKVETISHGIFTVSTLSWSFIFSLHVAVSWGLLYVLYG